MINKKNQEKIKLITFEQALKKITEEERKIAKNVLEGCLGVRKGESVLIVSDTFKRGIASIFFETAKEFTNNVRYLEMTPRKESGEEPPEMVAKEMLTAEVLLLVTSKSLSHTKARREATWQGARITSMPSITKDIALRTLGINYREVKTVTDRWADILTRANKVELTSLAGTKLFFNIEGKKCISDSGIFDQPGLFGNLPAGEAHLSPVEGTTRGVAIIDGSSFHSGFKLDKPIKLIIKKGMIQQVAGGLAAQKLKEAFRVLDAGARNIAELGIGTNHMTKLSEFVLEAEKVAGTVHIGLGNNISYGGTVNVPFHRDGVILKPKVKIDGVEVPLPKSSISIP